MKASIYHICISTWGKKSFYIQWEPPHNVLWTYSYWLKIKSFEYKIKKCASTEFTIILISRNLIRLYLKVQSVSWNKPLSLNAFHKTFHKKNTWVTRHKLQMISARLTKAIKFITSSLRADTPSDEVACWSPPSTSPGVELPVLLFGGQTIGGLLLTGIWGRVPGKERKING